MQSSFRAVVFDMDGTLFGTEQIAVDAIRTAFGERGVEVSTQALEVVIGRAGKETREYLGRFAPAEVGIEPILRRSSALIKARIERDGMPVKPGARELLELLRERALAIGLATSTRTAAARDNLRRAGIEGYFSTVIGGDAVENPKPHPEVYLRAASDLRVAPADAIAVEDSDLGIQAASAAGLRVIYVPDIKRIDPQSRALVHREYPSLLDLRDELAAGA
jgi:HAD superfamily hydrolase (TIGR01509 family)